jgi:hypothetical protein
VRKEFHPSVQAACIQRAEGDPTIGETVRSGRYLIKMPGKNYYLQCIVSDGMGWDHVSVTVHKQNRTPTWDEMSLIRSLFFDPEETVIEYHPPESKYINIHPYVLHMWRPQGFDIPLPPMIMV